MYEYIVMYYGFQYIPATLLKHYYVSNHAVGWPSTQLCMFEMTDDIWR